MCSPRGWDSSHLPALCSGKRPGPGAALLPPGAPARGQKRSGDEDILLVSVPSLTSQGRQEAMVCRGPWDVWNCSRGVGGWLALEKPRSNLSMEIFPSPASSSEMWRRYHQGSVPSQWTDCSTHPRLYRSPALSAGPPSLPGARKSSGLFLFQSCRVTGLESLLGGTRVHRGYMAGTWLHRLRRCLAWHRGRGGAGGLD